MYTTIAVSLSYILSIIYWFFLFQLIEQEAVELRNKFGTPRRSSLEDAGSSQLEEIDVIPNEEMLMV